MTKNNTFKVNIILLINVVWLKSESITCVTIVVVDIKRNRDSIEKGRKKAQVRMFSSVCLSSFYEICLHIAYGFSNISFICKICVYNMIEN